ncbi:hypothetical protein Tco_0783068 [Tanacetum coccineum]
MRGLVNHTKLFLRVKTTIPKDSEGTKQPCDMGLPSMVPDESMGKTKPLPVGPRTDAEYQVDLGVCNGGLGRFLAKPKTGTEYISITHPQDMERNIQLAVKGSHSPPNEGTRRSKPLSEGKLTDAKDPEGNIQLADSKGNKHSTDKGLPATVPNESIGKTKPLPKGPRKDKYSERLKPLADMESLTPHVTVLSGTDADYQVDQTQSTRFEVSVLDQHQGKTSYEVELDFEPLKLTTIADIQALLGTFDDDLKEDSDDDVFETQEEIDEDIYEPGTKETQTRHSTKHTTEEPHSQEHQSSSLNKDQPESSKAKKNDASDS